LSAPLKVPPSGSARVRETSAQVPLTKEDIRHIIREENLLAVPEERAYPVNYPTERTVLSTMFAGGRPPLWLPPEAFAHPLHAALFRVLQVAVEQAERPTVGELADLLEYLAPSTSPRLSWELEKIFQEPALVPLDPPSMLLVELMWRRDALPHISKADALIRLGDPRDLEEIATELETALAKVRGKERP
jgi:hypothetical protein